MARMSREFQLVLLGAGILTAGSFLWPDPDLAEVAEKNARDPNAGGNSSGGHRHRMGGYIMFIHPRSAPSRTFTSGATVRSGGFGGSGARFSAGG
jgi:hypothetical protein